MAEAYHHTLHQSDDSSSCNYILIPLVVIFALISHMQHMQVPFDPCVDLRICGFALDKYFVFCFDVMNLFFSSLPSLPTVPTDLIRSRCSSRARSATPCILTFSSTVFLASSA